MPEWNEVDTEEEGESISEYIACAVCEVEYTITLEEDFLDCQAQYCSFCGELLERE